MSAEAVGHRYNAHITVAGLLGLLGLASALSYMLWPNPYTMLSFLMVGQVLIVLGIVIFGYVVARDIKSRLERVVERNYSAGETIFRQGDLGDRLYVLNRGEVEVVRESPDGNESVIARLKPGEYFGEMALLSDAPRTATVRAATDVETLTIHRDDFASLFSSLPALRESIAEVTKQRRQPQE